MGRLNYLSLNWGELGIYSEPSIASQNDEKVVRNNGS